MGAKLGVGPRAACTGRGCGLGSGTLASGPVESEDVGLHNHTVPTELQPQDAVPLGLGAEDADWTQDLPWRPRDSYLLPLAKPPSSHGGVFKEWTCPWGRPMVLELGTTQAHGPC